MNETSTVYYDGTCNLCSGTVQWMIRNDKHGRFRFESQKDPEKEGNTVRLTRGNKEFYRSTAVLKIAAMLRFPWPLLSIFLLVPRFLRDPVYHLVARNRERWFGKRSAHLHP